MRSDDRPQLSVRGRRRLAVSLVGLVAAPAALLVACGNADKAVANDNRPDARASTQGARSELPSPVASDSVLNTPASGIPPEDEVYNPHFGERQNNG